MKAYSRANKQINTVVLHMQYYHVFEILYHVL